jgi:hypothetical protein
MDTVVSELQKYGMPLITDKLVTSDRYIFSTFTMSSRNMPRPTLYPVGQILQILQIVCY